MDALTLPVQTPPGQSSPTRLDPAETNVTNTNGGSAVGTIDADLTDDVSFRHSGWKSRRKQIDHALIESGASMSRMEAFRSCGQNAWVYEDPENPGTYSIKADLCKDRLCTPCQTARSNIIRRNLAPLMKGSETRFLTLTLKSRPGSLRDQLNRLIKSFRTLRNKAFWKDCVTSGAWVIEITYNAETGCFHPHVHALLKGKFIPKSLIVREWNAITGDSFIVDLQLVRQPEQATKYLAKYITKPIDSKLLNDPDALAEAIDALKGRRLITTIGEWRGVKLLDAETGEEWRPVCTLRELRERAQSGDTVAIGIATSLLEKMAWQKQPIQPDPADPGP